MQNLNKVRLENKGMKITRNQDRGTTKTGWLESFHSFSFANYYDPNRLNFGALRVVNDDIIKPGQGFSMHKHDNMEIITVLLKGKLRHEDSTENGFVLSPGDIQVMSAGTGIEHSEFNNSQSEDCELLQIWISPREEGIKPKYEYKTFKQEGAQIIASGYKNLGGLHIHQKAVVALMHGKTIKYTRSNPEFGVFAMMIEGEGKVGNETIHKKDSIELIGDLEITSENQCKVLIIEVPMSS